MSYSFSARGSTKAAVLEKIAAEMAKVVAAQPIHAADQAQAVAAAEAFVGVLPVDETKDVNVSINGSISSTETGITGASVSVYASNISKETPK